MTASATPTRTTHLGFVSGSITYNDGTTPTATAPVSGNILNSVEGWKWYKTVADGYAANTLVLNGLYLEITNSHHFAISLPGGSGITPTIILEGSNTIIATRNDNIVGILFTNSHVTIEGAGSLTVEADNTTSTGGSYGIMANSDGSLTIESGTVHVTARSGGSESFGLSTGSYGTLTISGGTVTASGDARAINNNYTVPNTHHYTVSANADGSSPTSGVSDGSFTIDGSHRWAQIIAPTGGGGVPPTGLPDLTGMTATMLALFALSAALWVYVAYSYVPRREHNRG